MKRWIQRIQQWQSQSLPTLTQTVGQILQEEYSMAREQEDDPRSSTVPVVYLEDGTEETYIWWGGHYLPLSWSQGHFLTVGITNSGKSLLTSIALASVVKAIKPGSQSRVVIFDTKGDVLCILQGLKVPFTLVNINDMRAASWDIAADCQDYMKAHELAEILVPAKNKHDSFWEDGARAAMCAVIKAFIYQHGSAWGLHDVYNALTSDKDTFIKILELYPRNKDFINMILRADAEKTVAGVMMELFVRLQKLLPAAVHSYHAKQAISLQTFLQTEGVLVISQDLTAREASNPIIRAMFRRLVDFIVASDDFSLGRTFLFLDEARFVGELPGLLDLVSFGRSKGASVWLSLQGVEGFYEVYGQHVADEIFGNCQFKTLLSITSPVTAKWASSLFGTTETWETVNVSNSKQRYKRERFLDSDFFDLPLPNKESGLTGIFVSSKTGAFKEYFPGDLLESLKPPEKQVPNQIPKPKELQTLNPWTDLERQRFIQGGNSKQNSTQDVPIPSTVWESWQVEIRKGVFDLVSDFVEQAVTER